MRGFVCLEKNISRMKDSVDCLRRMGVEPRDVVVVENCREAFRAMGRGDVLAVRSLRQLADSPQELVEGLERVRRAGGAVESLGEPWFDLRALPLGREQLEGLFGSPLRTAE